VALRPRTACLVRERTSTSPLPLSPTLLPTPRSDDFISTQMRRGRGGGSAAVFSQPLSGAFAQGLDSAQYTDPSAGWRNDIDGVAQISNRLWLSACCDGGWMGAMRVSLLPHVAVRAVSLRMHLVPHPTAPFLLSSPLPPPVAVFQGPANWWIDTVANSLKIGTVVGTPTGTAGYRDPTDLSGPQVWRDGSAYVKGRLATTTTTLDGAMGGAYFIYESGGVVADFEEFSVDIAAYDGGLGGAVGVVFAYNVFNSGKTHYCVVMKNHASETGIGL
jgi:hypothetical protein